MKTLPSLLAVLLLLGGCVPSHTALLSADGISEQFPMQSTALAEEAAVKLAEKYPAGKTILYVVPAQENPHFAKVLEQSLRFRGFAVSSDFEVSDVQISYQTDVMTTEKGHMGYWRIMASDGSMFSLVKPVGM